MENHKCGYGGRSKLAAFLFSFFLGFLGMDWFYLSFGTATYTVAGIFKIIVLLLAELGRKMTAIDDLRYILPGYLLCIFPVIWYLGDLIRILGDFLHNDFLSSARPHSQHVKQIVNLKTPLKLR